MDTASPTVDHVPDPSLPPPRPRLCLQVKLRDLLDRIAATLEATESVNAYVRAAVRHEADRRRAILDGELRDLDAADWSLLLAPGTVLQ